MTTQQDTLPLIIRLKSVLSTGDFEHDFRARVVTGVVTLLFPVVMALVVFEALAGQIFLSAMILLSPIAMLFAFWQLFVRGNLQFAARTAIAGMLVAAVAIVTISGGLATGPYVFLPAIFVVSATLCSWRFATQTAVACLLILVLGGCLAMTDWSFPYETSQARNLWGAYRISLASGIVCFGCMLFYFKSMAKMRVQLLEAQTRNLQSQKLVAIGTLASGIAHEINTPVQFVSDNLSFIGDSYEDLSGVLESITARLRENSVPGTEELKAEVEKVLAEADIEYVLEEMPRALAESRDGLNRVTTIVHAMKEFAHPGEEKRATIDLNAAVRSTLIVCANRWKYAADVATHYDPNLPAVDGLPDELNQVILNIIVNAADSIQERVDNNELSKGNITITTLSDDSSVELRVSDNGTGIPAEIRERVFEPFFTTKEVGKGTGQGLSISYDVIVNGHGGELLCESEPGQGTTFRIRLPISS